MRIPSKQNRESILTEAGQAIANKEQESMALYGGRPWTVTARVTEPKGQKPPLFRWFRGELELAVLPHLLEKIPDPPKLKGNQEYTEEDEYVPSTSLEERTVSSLSWVAWENREYAIPNVTVKWLSPDHVYFYSRKQAWEHQNKLAEQQLFLQKMIHGLGHRGQKLKPFKPTKNDAMKAGKWRFLRDGLWVVGQEEAWQEERAEWWEEELERKAAAQAALEAERKKQEAANKSSETDKKPSGKRRLTAIALYLQSKRSSYREEKMKERKLAQGDSTEPVTRMTLRQAETELRVVWKTLSSEEQNQWKERAKQLACEEASVKPAASNGEVAAEQMHNGIQAPKAVASDGAPGELPSHTPVSPSPPLVPTSELVPGSKVIPEGTPDPLPNKESGEGNEETQKTSVSLEPGSQVLSESEASNGEIGTATETKNTSVSNAPKDGTKPTCVSVELQSQAFNAALVAPCMQVDNSAQQATMGQPVVTTERSEPASRDSSESNASKNESGQVTTGTQAGTAPTPPTSQPTSKAEANGVTSVKKSPVTASSSKKRRKSSLHPPKKITPSSQFHLTPSQIELCHAAVTNHFEMVMNTVKARALHSELQDGFDLLRERGRGRYDMELPAFDTPEFSFLTDLQNAAWMPIVREVLGEDVVLIHKGAFLSMPGAEGQVYHQDGPHLSTQTQRPCHAVNVFIPLVDLTIKNGPTEFCLGTHVLGHEDFVKDRVFTPCVPAGTPVMFDYRLGHRGLANTSGACRPIVYCTYAATANGKEFRDSVNFSRRRYHKIGELVEKPLSRAERAAKRRKSLSEVADPPVETTAAPEEPKTTTSSIETHAAAREAEQGPVPVETSAAPAVSEGEAETTTVPTSRPASTRESEESKSTETRMQVCESEEMTASIQPSIGGSERPRVPGLLVAAPAGPPTARSGLPPPPRNYIPYGDGAHGAQQQHSNGYPNASVHSQLRMLQDPRYTRHLVGLDAASIAAPYHLAQQGHAHQNYVSGYAHHFPYHYADPGVSMQHYPAVSSLPPSSEEAAFAMLRQNGDSESGKPPSSK